MVRPTPKVPFIYRDYALLPDDGRRHELIEGDFFVTPAPTPSHQTVSRRLKFALMQQLEVPGIALVFNAPIDLILADTSVVQPDLLVLRTSRAALITGRAIEGPPDLVVEIVSPGSRTLDEVQKRDLYARHGVPEYWLVEPTPGLVTVHRIQEGALQPVVRSDRTSTLTSPEFPELSIPLEPVFGP